MTEVPVSAIPPDRYLVALPQGISKWIRSPIASCERGLMQHVLAQPGGCKIDVKSLAQTLLVTPKALSTALFVLNRHQSVVVQTEEPPSHPARSPWASLREHLEGMAERANAHGIALADPQGLCIASSNLSENQAQQLAAAQKVDEGRRPVRQVPLFLDASGQHYSVCSHEPIENDDPGWVSLVHHLLSLHRPCAPAATKHLAAQPQSPET